MRGGVRKDEDQIVTEVRGYEWAVPGERGRPSEHSVFFNMTITCANKIFKKKKSYFPYWLSVGGTSLSFVLSHCLHVLLPSQ